MKRLFFLAFATIVAAASMMWVAPANAQATRTWVSGVGDDVNPCSRTAPCRTFAGAISKTATFGEINCLDPGGFGTVTVTKSITISCPHGEGGISAGLTNGIIVNLPNDTDRVMLEYLDIDGASSGLNGVNMINKGTVLIKDCVIRGFGGASPSGNGIRLAGAAGARAVIMDTTILYNRGGVRIEGASGAANAANISNVMFDKNTEFALKLNATGGVILDDTFMAGSTSSIIAVAGAQVISYGNNIFRNAGLPTQTLPQQ